MTTTKQSLLSAETFDCTTTFSGVLAAEKQTNKQTKSFHVYDTMADIQYQACFGNCLKTIKPQKIKIKKISTRSFTLSSVRTANKKKVDEMHRN